MESYRSLPEHQRLTQDSIASKAFDQFIHHLQLSSTLQDFDPSIRRTSIKLILSDLQAHLDGKSNWSSDTTLSALITLKLLGRSPIATDDLIPQFPLLISYANLVPPNSSLPPHPTIPRSGESNPSIAHEALRILSNTLLLHPLSRSSTDLLSALSSSVELAFHRLTQALDPHPAEPIKGHANQDISSFLASRLIFLITAVPSNLVVELIEATNFIHYLQDAFKQEISKSLGLPSSHSYRPIPPDTFIEHLKIFFNVMVHYPKSVHQHGHARIPMTSNSPQPVTTSATSHTDSPSSANRPTTSFKQRLINQIGLKKFTRRTRSEFSTSKDQQELLQHELPADNDLHDHPKNDIPSSSNSKVYSRINSLHQEEEAVGYVTDPLNNVFAGLLPHLIQLFLMESIPHPPNLKPPLTSFIHCFLNFSPSAQPFFTNSDLPDDDESDIIPPVIMKLITILERVTEYYCLDNPDDPSVKNKCRADGIDLDVDLTQVFLLTTNLISPHPLSDGSLPTGISLESRQSLIQKIIPSAIDRTIPLNKQINFIGRILRLMNSVGYETLKQVCGAFLCALYGDDTDLLVSQVGYGPLAGYFLSIGKTGLNPDNKHSTPTNVNPITGAYWSSEASEDPAASVMSDADKEKEADRLCELFDRMNRGGVMSVQDPRRLAVETGRFQEIDEALQLEQEEQEKVDEMQALKELEQYKKKKIPKEPSQSSAGVA